MGQWRAWSYQAHVTFKHIDELRQAIDTAVLQELTDLTNALGSSNVTVSTSSTGLGNGDISVNTPVTYNSANSLSLVADRNITLISGNGITNAGSGAVNLQAVNTLTVNANLSSAGGVNIKAANATFNGGASYRGRTWELSFTAASQLTAREDAAQTSRNTVSLFGNRLFEDRWFASVLGQIQENEELDLDLRTVGGGGVGRFLRRSTHVTLATYGGLVYTRERFVGEPTDNSAEIAAGGQFDAFTTRSNDFTLTNTVVAYFAVTGRARTRVELQTAWRHEFLSDFYWSLNALESFDSSPPSETAKKNDFSVSLALGWKF